jgi:hypothetical protein
MRITSRVQPESSQDRKMHSIIDLLNSRGTASYITQNEHRLSRQTPTYELPPIPISPSTRSHKGRAYLLHPPQVTALKAQIAKCHSIDTSPPSSYQKPSCSSHTNHRQFTTIPQCHTHESTAGGLIPLSTSHFSTFSSQQTA